MASTQYIGARYVPLFYTDPDTGSNAWRSGIAYDPLTIVTDLNQSYTSKIPVPATVGRPSENPTYWILTGAYNAQVEQYRQEVAEVRTDVDNLQTDVSDLQTEVAKEKDYVLFVSDSYGVDSAGIISFPNILENYHIKNFVEDFDTVAINGAGFATVSGQQSFTDLINNYSGDLVDKITRIIVVGGTNDAKLSFTTQVTSGISQFTSAAITKFANLRQIDILYMAHVAANSYGYANVLNTYKTYMAYRSSFPVYIHNAINVFSMNDLQTDKMHPNQTGQYQIARAITEFIATGEIPIDTSPVVVTGSMPSGCAATIKPGREYSTVAFSAIVTGQTSLDITGCDLRNSETIVLTDTTLIDTGNANALRHCWVQYTGGSGSALRFINPLPAGNANSAYTIFMAAEATILTGGISLMA